MFISRNMTLTTFVSATAILLLFSIHLCSGDLEPIFQDCCQTGEVWALNHTTCTGPSRTAGSVQTKDRLTCLTALYICCIRFHRKAECERGKEAAIEGRQCGSANDIFRDCCDGCNLGIQAGIKRSPCGFSLFSFGAPWDEAYIDCCERSNLRQGTSHLTSKAVCKPNEPCTQKCDVIGNEIKCSCYVGYKLAEDLASCDDEDECELGSHSCNPVTEICVNRIGGFECVSHPGRPQPGRPGHCPAGFSMNPQTRTCDDIDECLQRPCPQDKLCVNNVGSFECISQDEPCSPGFAYNEETGYCIDVDECSEGIDRCNHTFQICQNSHGAYQCIHKPSKIKECPAGFKWNDIKNNCEDFDECQEGLHDCDISKECRNTIGGYECDEKCSILMNFDPVQNKCVENSACVDRLHKCKSNELCIPTPDSPQGYVCVLKSQNNPCPAGFKPAEGQKCEDINECEEFADTCDAGQICTNGIGSYDCVPDPRHQQQQQQCSPGFRFDDVRNQCVDINECLENLDHCNRATHDCVNHNGTHECVAKITATQQCPPGYRINPRTDACEDVNECIEGRHKCFPDNEQCVNVPGAYRCQQITTYIPCPPGHRFNTTTTTCRDINECLEGTHSCNPSTENCVNAVGSYRCVAKVSCPHGYHWIGNKCDDINECQEDSDDCDPRTQICVNTVGSYQCQSRSTRTTRCGTGYVYDAVQDECSDLDECAILRPCSDEQFCENTIGSYKCTCSQGYIFDSITRECKDINECQLGLYACDLNQRCDNTIGSYTCVRTISCGTGYTLNSETGQCEDDDECLLGSHNCGPGFTCRNIQGSFRCDRTQCPSGQKLLSDGTCKAVFCGRGLEPDDTGNCIDINECATENICRKNQFCKNTVGSYRCQNLLNCPAGYELNEIGNLCVDVDECARRLYNCGPQQTCHNRPGGYVCECPRGYTLNLQMECEDVDECTRFRGQICSRMSECINTQGSYVCNCKEGFRKSDDDKNCDDIDECAESPNLCHQVCNNVWGSYQCSCQPGFTLGPDDRYCQDIDECKTYEGHGELCIGYCVNEPGSFSCSCPSGYRLSSDKRTCQDIDECQEQNVCVGDREVCLNTRGSYKCNRISCPSGYVRDKDHRNRCKKATQNCPFGDLECVNKPKSFSYNYITFVSNIRIPYSGQLDLFTMRGPRMSVTTVQFNLELKDARAPVGIPVATRDYFNLRRTSYNEAMVSLIKSIQGPQEIELDLVLKMYHNGKFAGNAVAKIFIFVTEHKF